MKKSVYIISLILLSVQLFSCQREVEDILSDNRTDTTARLVSTYRVVEVNALSVPQDSFTRVFKTYVSGTTKTVVETMVSSFAPTDTGITTFSYNADGKLTSIKDIWARDPATILSETRFTWNAGRLTKAVFDTMGVFERSIDFNYSAAGGNTVVTPLETPSQDIILPNYTSRITHKFTVDNQFQPVQDYWVRHTIDNQGSTPGYYHDTSTIIYTYAGGDLVQRSFNVAAYDTTGPSTEFRNDTTVYSYSRHTGGGNISDSLKVLYGPEIFTLINFMWLPQVPDFILWNPQSVLYFCNRPFNSSNIATHRWVNGVFDPGGSHNFLEKKIVSVLDAQQRLVRADLYADYSTIDIETTIRVYY